MILSGDVFDARQRSRFTRPDAGCWIRPDAARWLRLPHPDELKYSPDQPRDRWTDGGGGSGNSSVSPIGQIDFGDLPNFSDLFGLFQISPAETGPAGVALASDEQQGYPVDLENLGAIQ